MVGNLLEEIWKRNKNSQNDAILYKRMGRINKISYSKLFDYVFRFSSFLKKQGVKKGDKVLISLDNSPEFYIIDLACLNLGAIVVPIVGINQEDFNYILSETKPKLIFSDKEVKGENNFKINLENPLEDNLNLRGNSLRFFEKSKISNICYTSGSSGKPKGVLISADSILSNILSHPFDFSSGELMVSYLPLSHMFERVCGFYAPLYRGSIISISSPKNLISDLKDYRPHVLLAVPRVLEKVYDSINNRFISRLLLNLPFGKKIISKKLRTKLGGRFRYFVSGGSKLDESKNKFFWELGVRVFEGYGMTEAGPVISTNHEKEYFHGSVGKPLKGIEVKIDNEEILIKSPGLMKGYFNEKRLKKGDWFRTGDRGFIDNKGFLYVLGRLDDKIILTNSKKTYPEPIENKLNQSKYIEQSVVYGNGRPFLVALVVSKFSRGEILKEIERINNGLNWYERIRKFRIISEEFSVENGLLTPSQKVRRKKIYEFYQDLIEGCYND